MAASEKPHRAGKIVFSRTLTTALLADRLRQARAAAADPPAALGALVVAYVEFAREQPAYFQLMFRPELSRSEKTPDLQTAGDAAFDLLVEAVRECQRAGAAPGGDPGPLVGMVWALGHGLAALWLDGPLEDRTGHRRPNKLDH